MSVISALDIQVPTWPQIVATILPAGATEDGIRGQVLIDTAAHTVSGETTEDVNRRMNAVVAKHARQLERPVRMDFSGDVSFQVIIYPDGGGVMAAEGAASTHPRSADQDTVPAPTPEPVVTSIPEAPTVVAPPPPVSTNSSPSSADFDWPTRWDETPGSASTGGPAPVASAATAPSVLEVPTLAALLEGRARSKPTPAQHGWRAGLRALTGGAVSPAPGRAELTHRAAAASIARPLDGPKTVVVVNPKGGAHKTTAALLIAANLGLHRGGSTLAWDNNETRGTMGWRAAQSDHTRTAIDLLAGLDHLAGAGVRIGDLDAYVRAQPWGHFDVLASDEDAASADLVDGDAFEALHATLSRFYRVMVVDTGNNMRAPNWAAALAAADQLVIVSTIRQDTSQSAAWLADALRATGHSDLVANAVTVLTAPAPPTGPARKTTTALTDRLTDHFTRLTRAVISVPHDPALVPGGPIDYAALTPASREAWLAATAAVAAGL